MGRYRPQSWPDYFLVGPGFGRGDGRQRMGISE